MSLSEEDKQLTLFDAVKNNNVSGICELLSTGADVNTTDENWKRTPLFYAVLGNFENVVHVLIKAGANVNVKDKERNNCLFFAVSNDQKNIIHALIDANADVNVIDNFQKRTPLFYAVSNNNREVVEALIAAGADVNKTDNNGETALFSAVKYDNESIVRVLIAADADVNKTSNDGETALFSASGIMGNESIVRVLIAADADVNKTSNDGETALFSAVEYDNESIVRVLIAADADVNKTSNYGETALFSASGMGNESIVRVLIAAGADVNKTIDGETALFSAVGYGNESIVQALIAAGADVNKTDNNGETALIGAVKYDNESIVQALIAAGADVNKTSTDDEETALFSAVMNDNESIVQVLIGSRTNVNKTDNNCEAALFHASGSNHQGACAPSLLDAASADVKKTPSQTILGLGGHVKALINVRNRYGRTPLFYALQNYSPAVARLLIENDGIFYLKDKCNLSILSFFIEKRLSLPVFARTDLSKQFDLLFENGVAKNLIVKSFIEVLFCRIMLRCTPLSEDSYLSSMDRESLSEFLSIADDPTKKTIENILEQASNEQLSQIVIKVRELGADLSSADSHGNTILHYVTLLPFAGVPQTEIMKICHLLRAYGATMNFKNHQGQTPLLFCLSELSSHLQWLLRTDGVKMLVEISKLLLTCGTKVNDTLPNGKSIFHLIIDIFQQGLQLQDDAVRQRVLNEMLKLLQLFSDANAKQAKHFANGRVHLYLVLHSWASLTLPSSQNYLSDVILNTFEELLKAVLQLLLKCKANPNTRDDDQRTPLHHCKTWSAVKLLIDAGANTDAVDSSRHTPLFAAAERKTFLERSDSFYPDVSEDSKTFWKTAIKMNLDPWAVVDQNENSVLSILIKYKAFVLAKALIEVTCEDKRIESDSIAYPVLNAICKDQSTHTRWKTNLVEIILNSRQKMLLENLHVPLLFCCKNIIDFHGSADDSLSFSKGAKRKLVDDYAYVQPMLKKRKTDESCSDVEIGNTENKELAFYDSVHCEIARLLLLYGADYRKSDSTGKSCFDLADTCPELKDLLMEPRDENKISKRIPWESVSKRYENMLAKVSRGQEKEIVGSFWYNKDQIGRGTYGHVFTGINEDDGREVAIKRIEKLRMKRPEDEREITNLTKLADCKQVVSYVSFLEDKNFSYIVLELMEGDLKHYFEEGPFDKSKSVLLCKDLIKGLRYLHEQKIIHRDLKPGNILYKTHPRLCLKMADFGLSCYCVNNTSTTVYGHTLIAGTRCWIAPEILASTSGDNFTENSDTFSCGLLLHYILSKQKHPFSPESSSAPHIIEANIISNKMDGWDACISPEGTDLVKKMLKKSEGERISPADALAHPFFWTRSKIKDFLIAVGNQPEFELPPSNPNRKIEETDLEKDLNSSMTFQTVVKCESWDDPKNKLMAKFYLEMKKRRKYDIQSIVDLVRLIRNGYAHFDTLSHKIRRMLLTNFAYLDYFPDLVMEVFKAVTAHGWDSRPQIKDAMTK